MRSLSVFSHNSVDYVINDPNIADEFDATATYAAGDHVFYEGTLYEFTAAHSGAWTGTDVDAVLLVDALNKTKAEIEQEMDDFREEVATTLGDVGTSTKDNLPNLIDGVSWTNGWYIGESGNLAEMAHMMYSSPIAVKRAASSTFPIEATNANRYIMSYVAEKMPMTIRVHGYSGTSTNDWVKQLGTIARSNTVVGETYNITFDVTDVDYIRISICDYYHPYLCQPVEYTIDLEDKRIEAELVSMTGQKNLINDTWWNNHGMVQQNGQVDTTKLNMKYSGPIAVAPNKTYVLGFCTRIGRTLQEISVVGYDANNNTKLIGVVPTALQTAGTPKWFAFNPNGCVQIIINMGTGYQCSLSAQNALGEAAVEGLLYVTTCSWEEDSISFSTGKNSNASTASPRIRTPGYADLSAEFIKTDNLEFALYGYNRDQKESFSSDLTGTFLGVWDGTKFATGSAKFFQSVNMRQIYEQYRATYPNLLYRLVARIPGGPAEGETGAITPADGAQVKIYSRGNTSLYATLGLYSRWAVCGASFDSGSTHDTETERPYVGANQYDRSWPQILARRCGNTCTNYTKGGFTLKTFITDDTETGGRKRGLEQALRDDPQELYVITLGGNDTSRTLGTIADINDNDPDSNPETVYGLYGKIVQKLINHAKVDGYCTAKFILTTPSSAGGNWYSPAQLNIDNAIRAIGAHYGFPVVAWESDEFMRSDIFLKHMLGSHPTGILYSGMALAFERLFARAVMADPDYFNYE